MRRKVLLDRRAERDIDDHFATIAAGAGEDAAVRFHDHAFQTIRLIGWMPGGGRVWGFKRKRLASTRVWPIKGFATSLSSTRESRGGVRVVRVLHGARDIERRSLRTSEFDGMQ